MQTIKFLEGGEYYVTGDEMLRRGGTEMAGTGDLDHYLANQEDIPEEYRGKWLVFGGWARESVGHRSVPYLYWDGVRWVLGWFWLVDSFGRIDLLVRVRKGGESAAGTRSGKKLTGKVGNMEEEIVFLSNDTVRGIDTQIASIKKWQAEGGHANPRETALVMTKLEEARMWALQMVKRD